MDLSGDLSKLKVVELKAELAARGLDTKGIKAMLVSRLEAALAAEKSGTSLPITTSETPQSLPQDAPMQEYEEDSGQTEQPPPQAVEPSPARPTRRRRTRSTTKSPSPEPKKALTEPALAPLQEETEPVYQNYSATTEPHVAETAQEVTRMEVDQVQESAEPQKTEITTEETQVTQKEADTQETEEENKGQKRSREDSKSPSRKRSSSVEPHSNDFTNDEDEPAIDDNKFLLSWFDSDLHLKIDQTDFLHAKPISDAGLNLVWAGARANHGVTRGKVAFEVYLSNYNRVNHSQEDRRIHEFRCGWSVRDTNLQLGEAPLSFGFDSNGKKCTDSKFEDYGKRYSLFDVIGVYLDLESTPCTIEYTINGESQGKAFEFEKESLEGKALYPQISTKNIGYAVNFGQTLPTLYSSVPPKPKDNRRDRNTNRRSNDNNKSKFDENVKKESDATKKTDDEMWDEQPEVKPQVTENNGEEQQTGTENADETSNQETTENVQEQSSTDASSQQESATTESETKTAEVEEKPGSKELLPDYIFIDQSPPDALEAGPRRPESRKDCEVILMIGLPGTGKTYWARNWVKEHPEKRYNAFGVQFLLEKMKINGEPRKPNQSYRWSQIVESLSRSLNILLNIACRRRRNYIFDQPNVYANLQRRKMSRFGDFTRKAVIVFPDEETHKERAAKRIEEQGKEYSPINEEEMKSKISLPVLEHTWFNEILYTELPEEKAREMVVKINEEGQAARKKRKEGRDDRSRQRYQKFQDNRREPWRQQRFGPGGGGWDRRPGEGYGYGRPDRFRDQWGANQNNWVRGAQGYQRQGGMGGRFDQPRRQDDRRRNQMPDNKRQKTGGDKSNWASNNWSTYGQGQGFAQGGAGGWAQQWPPQGARGQGANGNQYGGTWW